MVSPKPAWLHQRVWDAMRERFKIDLKKVKTKKDLLNKIKGRYKDPNRLPGKRKSLYFYIKKTDFYGWLRQNYVRVRTKTGKIYIRERPKRWLKHEERVLLELGKHYKGKELYKEFLKRFPERPRSYKSILTKYYRLRKKYRGED